MSQKQAIVFDLGGVLIDWNPRYLYRKLFADDETAMEKFLAEVCNSDWNVQQDKGRPFADAVAELAAQHPAHEPMIRAFFERWPEMVSGAIEGTVAILHELRAARHPLYALSNWSAETYPHARKRFDFFEHFDHIVISGQIRMIKPDREIFDHLLAQTSRRAEECLFIDDSGLNIHAARALGFDAIHFTSPAQLRRELGARGILRV
jgi:2-haloacid dehalogenase